MEHSRNNSATLGDMPSLLSSPNSQQHQGGTAKNPLSSSYASAVLNPSALGSLHCSRSGYGAGSSSGGTAPSPLHNPMALPSSFNSSANDDVEDGVPAVGNNNDDPLSRNRTKRRYFGMEVDSTERGKKGHHQKEQEDSISATFENLASIRSAGGSHQHQPAVAGVTNNNQQDTNQQQQTVEAELISSFAANESFGAFSDLGETLIEALPTFKKLWFMNPEHEAAYVHAMFYQSRFRFLVLGLVMILASLVALPTISNTTEYQFVVIGLLLLAAAFIFDAIVVGISVVLDRKEKSGSDEEHEGRYASTTLTSSSSQKSSDQVRRRRRRRRRGGGHRSSSYRDEVVLARLHEGIVAFLCFALAVFYTFYQRWLTGSCFFHVHYKDGFKHDEGCPPLHGAALVYMMIPLIVSQPRFFITAIILAGASVFTVGHLRFHNVTLFGTVTLLLLYIAHLFFIAAFKFVMEQQDRLGFQTHRELVGHLDEIRWHNSHLKKLALQFTPKHLHSRISKSSSVQVDISREALALVCQINDCAKFLQRFLPSAAAGKVTSFFHFCEEASASFGFHHIRSFGDSTYFVSNLFNEDHCSVADGTLSGIQFAAAFAASTKDAQHEWFTVQSGLACGSLTGMPLGSTCIRYDVFGEAIANARSLVARCPGGQVCVQKELLPLLGIGVTVHDAEACFVSIAAGAENVRVPVVSAAQPSVNSINGTMHNTMVELDIDDDARSVGSTTSSFGDPHASSSASIVTTLDVKQTPGCCCNLCCSDFLDEDTQNLCAHYSRKMVAPIFTFCNVFYAVMVAIVITNGVEERHDALVGEGRDIWMIVFVVTMMISLVFFIALAILSASARKAGEPHRSWHSGVFLFNCLIAMVGNNFARPASIGNHNLHFFWSMTFTATMIGTLPQAIVFQFIAIAAYFSAAILFRPMLSDIELYAFTGTFIFSVIAAQHHKMQRNIVAELIKNREAFDEEDKLLRVVEAVHESNIPRAIQVYTDMWSRKRDGEVDAWGSSDCLVMTVIFHQDQELLAQLASNAQPLLLREYAECSTRIVEKLVANLEHQTLSILKVFGGAMTIAGPLMHGVERKKPAKTNNNTEEEQLDNMPHNEEESRQRSTIVDAVQDAMEFLQALHVIYKCRMSNATHFTNAAASTTTTTAALSDSTNGEPSSGGGAESGSRSAVTSATSPLAATSSRQLPSVNQMRSPSASQNASDTSTASSQRTVSRSLRGVVAAATNRRSPNSSGVWGSSWQQNHPPLPPYTVAAVTEHVLHILRLTQFPTYELMGPAVNLSRAIAAAAPAPMTIVEEKLAELYQRECGNQQQFASSTMSRDSAGGGGSGLAPLFRDPESWRLKDVGVIRVRGVYF